MSEGESGALRDRIMKLVGQILDAEGPVGPLPVDHSLSDLGMSSIKMVDLMLVVEAEFDIVIPEAEITPENFLSISSIEALVAQLLTSGS